MYGCSHYVFRRSDVQHCGVRVFTLRVQLLFPLRLATGEECTDANAGPGISQRWPCLRLRKLVVYNLTGGLHP